MKKKLWLAVLTIIAVFTLVIGITACDNKQPNTRQPEAQQLETPIVSISEEGLASWTANENASGYSYKLDDGEEKSTDKTSVQLTDGQSISVKALGKTGYKDSEYSSPKTYTASTHTHSYGEPAWNWTGSDEEGYTAATAAFNCKNGDDTQSKPATVTSSIEKNATCTEDGKEVYTATVIFKEKTYTDSKNVTISSLGHDYNSYEVTVLPTDDNTGTAIMTCTNEGCNEKTVTVTLPVLTDERYGKTGDTATCTDEGEIVYTIELTEGTFEFTVETSELGHSLVWESDETGHWQECERCTHKEETEEHTWGAWEVDKDDATKHTRTTTCTMHADHQYSESKAHNFENGACSDCDYSHDHVELKTKTNNTHHWTECEDCGYKTEEIAHTWTYTSKNGSQHTKTSACSEHGAVEVDEDHTTVVDCDEHEHWDKCTLCTYASENKVAHEWTYASKNETQHTKTSTCDGHEAVKTDEDHTRSVKHDNTSHWEGCEHCDYAGVEKINHTWGAWTVDAQDSTKHTRTSNCTVHEEQYTESEPHNYEKGVCTDCQAQDPDYSTATWVEFDFTDIVTSINSTAYTTATAEDVFKKAISDETVKFGVKATNNLYPEGSADLGQIKFSSSKTGGSITLEFKKNVKRVVISATKYGNDNSSLSVNGGAVQSTQSTVADYIFNFTPTNTVKIDATNRSYVYSITIYFEDYQAKLDTPAVSIDLDGVVTWSEVANATKYAYQIGEGAITYVELAEERSVQLADGETVKVWAVGDTEYADSEVATITYTMIPVTLAVPMVEVSLAGLASWGAVENAVKYVYVIIGVESNGTEQETTNLSVQLTDGQSIKVKAIGRENSRFRESAYCEPVSYTAPTQAEQLGVPTVTVEIDGTVTIKNANAVSFDYTIGGGETQNIANGADGAAVTLEAKLTNGQTIKVIAKGDGTYSTDSEEVEVTYLAPLTFDAPTDIEVGADTVTEGNVLVTWTAVDGATSYTVTIDGEEFVTNKAEYSVEFKEVASITVKTNGNGVIEGNGADYSGIIYASQAVDVTEKFNEYYEANKPAVTEDTISFANLFNSNGGTVTTVTGVNGVAVVTFDKKTGTAPAYYSNAVRVYTNNEFTISAQGKTIAKLQFTYDAGNYTAGGAGVNTGTIDSTGAEWNGSAAQVVITNTTGHQIRIQKIVVILDVPLDDQGKVNKVKESLAIDDPVTDDDWYMFELPLTDELEYGTTITWGFEGLISDNGDEFEDDVLTVMRRDDEAVITATATISLNGKTAEKEFTLTIPARGGEVTPPPATKTWQKVTSVDQLTDNSQVIIVASGNAMGKISGSNAYAGYTAITFDGDIPNVTDSITVLTINKGTTAGKFSLKYDDGNYIYATAAKSVKTRTTAYYWTITISSGEAKIMAETTSHGWLQYNSGSPRFTTYASSQTMPTMYVLA